MGASFDSPTTPAVSLYIVTGYPGTEHQKYNMVTDVWVTRNSIPTSRQAGSSSACGGGGAAAVALGSTHIYVFGSGFSPPLTYGRLNEQYTILTDLWTSRRSMPLGRSGSAAAASGSKLFVVGGCTFPLASSTSKLEIYDASTDAWVTGTHKHIFKGLRRAGLCHLFCVIPSVTRLRMTAGTSMPTSRYLMAADLTANYMYVVGGLRTATPAGGLLEMYATQSDSWLTGARFRVRILCVRRSALQYEFGGGGSAEPWAAGLGSGYGVHGTG